MESKKKIGESHVIDQIENKMLSMASLSFTISRRVFSKIFGTCLCWASEKENS